MFTHKKLISLVFLSIVMLTGGQQVLANGYSDIYQPLLSNGTWVVSEASPTDFAWVLPEYDDSAWDDVFSPYPNDFTKPGDILPGSNAKLIWNWTEATPPTGEDGPIESWFRYNFTLDIEDWLALGNECGGGTPLRSKRGCHPVTAEILVIADDAFKIYVNGNNVLKRIHYLNDNQDENGKPIPLRVDIMPYLNTGGDNVIAMYAFDGGRLTGNQRGGAEDLKNEYIFLDGVVTDGIRVIPDGTSHSAGIHDGIFFNRVFRYTVPEGEEWIIRVFFECFIVDGCSGENEPLLGAGTLIEETVKPCGSHYCTSKKYLAGSGDYTVRVFTSAEIANISATVRLAEDLNGDDCIDRNDLNEVIAAIRSRSNDLKFDINNDGVINIADARRLVTQFTTPRGATCVVQATWNSDFQINGNWTENNWTFDPLLPGVVFPNNNGTRFNVVIDDFLDVGIDDRALVTVTEDVNIENLTINSADELRILDGANFTAKNITLNGGIRAVRLIVAGNGSSLQANTITTSGEDGFINVGAGANILVDSSFAVTYDDGLVLIAPTGTLKILNGNYINPSVTEVQGLLEITDGNFEKSGVFNVSGRIEVNGVFSIPSHNLGGNTVSGVIAANEIELDYTVFSDLFINRGGRLQVGGNLKNQDIEPNTLIVNDKGILRFRGNPPIPFHDFHSFDGTAKFAPGGKIAFELNDISTLRSGDSIVLFVANGGITTELNTLDISVNDIPIKNSRYRVVIENNNKLVLKIL